MLLKTGMKGVVGLADILLATQGTLDEVNNVCSAAGSIAHNPKMFRVGV